MRRPPDETTPSPGAPDDAAARRTAPPVVAEIDVLAALSACPGGDCGTGHSSDAAPCHPLEVTIYDPVDDTWPAPTAGAYDRSHGA